MNQKTSDPNTKIPDQFITDEERTLYNFGIERSFLACIFKKPTLMGEALSLVGDDHFFFPDHRMVFQLMVDLHTNCMLAQRPLAINSEMMMQLARHRGPSHEQHFFTTTNGMEKVKEIEGLVLRVDASQFSGYADQLRKIYTRVSVYRKCREIQTSTLNSSENQDPGIITTRAEGAFASLTQNVAENPNKKMTPLASHHKTWAEQSSLTREHGHGLFSVSVGSMPTIMKLAGGGFRRGSLTLISARPKTGKSTLLGEIAIQFGVVQKQPALILDSEMSRGEFYTRTLSMLSGIPEPEIVSGRAHDLEVVQRANYAMQQGLIQYVNVAGQSIDYVCSQIVQFQKGCVGNQTVTSNGRSYEFSRPAIVLYDWLKVTDPNEISNNKAEWLLLGNHCSRLKDVAGYTDMAVVAACQQNRVVVGADQFKWETEQESFVGGSDRLNQFCSMMCSLRHLFPQEEEMVRANLPLRADREGNDQLAFNQVLGITYNRHGPEYRRGIPFYHDHGRFHMIEMGKFSHDISGMGYADQDSYGLCSRIDHLRLEARKRTSGKTSASPSPSVTAPVGS